MFDSGYKSIEDIKHASLDDLANLPTIGPKLAKKVKEQVGGFFKKEEWERIDTATEWKQKTIGDF
jgi:hypothetical protein